MMSRELAVLLAGIALCATGATQLIMGQTTAPAAKPPSSDQTGPGPGTDGEPPRQPLLRATEPADPAPVPSPPASSRSGSRLLDSRQLTLGGRKLTVERFTRSYCITVMDRSPLCSLQKLDSDLPVQVVPLEGIAIINARARITRVLVRTDRRKRVELRPTDALGLRLAVFNLEAREDIIRVKGLDKDGRLVKQLEFPQIGR